MRYRYSLRARPRATFAAVSIGAALSGAVLLGQGGQNLPSPVDASRELALKVRDGFTLVAVGDMLIQRPAMYRTDKPFVDAIKLLQNADVTFANMETSIADLREIGVPFRSFIAVPEVANDVKAMGIDLVNRANNHVVDAGIEGMIETDALLDKAGIVHAGTGRSLYEARQARYLEKSGQRIGLVGLTSTFDVFSVGQAMAGDAYQNSPAKPGENGLRVTPTLVVSQEQIDSLKKMRDSMYEARAKVSNPVPAVTNESPQTLAGAQIFGRDFKVGPNPGTLTWTMNPEDRQQILQNVKNGKMFSDLMIVTIHTHEGTSVAQRQHFADYPADFLIDFAHAAIDNGADAFFGHGVHVLRGIEIYKGRPIFYGLGEFFREMERSQGTAYLPRNAFPATSNLTEAELKVIGVKNIARERDNYESIIAHMTYAGGQVSEVRLYPVELGFEGPISEAGVPRLAKPDVARSILTRLQKLSEPFGTTIAIEQNVGVIRLKTTSSR